MPNNPFTDEDLEKIGQFVKDYDRLYKEMSHLESNVQKMLKAQEAISNALTAKRKEEFEFFAMIAEREAAEIEYLKKLATTWMEENRLKTFSSTGI